MRRDPAEHVDVLIVGAGLSGIGAACQLREHLPTKSVAVLEAREASGGTWDLFKYPGIRSDSDMFTFGFGWRPWPGDRALADGPSILDYLRTVAAEYGVDELIRYRHKVTGASWDSETARWTVEIDHAGTPTTLTASFLWGCAGYYHYDEPYAPEFPGADSFEGTIVHPQHWPEDLEYAGQKVVVIGSGATAVTLVPAMAGTAGHVTMLQRSPTYVASRPARDKLASLLGRLPAKYAFPVVRGPTSSAASSRSGCAATGPTSSSGSSARPLRPSCRTPWTSTCTSSRRTTRGTSGSAWCRTVTCSGRCARGRPRSSPTPSRRSRRRASGSASGQTLEADLIVTATGLQFLPFGGIDLVVDGERVDLPSTMMYKALMLSGVPNFAFTAGYTNASWTLKADLVAEYVVRLLGHLDLTGARSAVPVRQPGVGEQPFMDFTSGYILRVLDRMPSQGDREPWRLKQNYVADVRKIRRGRIDDGVLAFDLVPAGSSDPALTSV